jgi:hypothetical protein
MSVQNLYGDPGPQKCHWQHSAPCRVIVRTLGKAAAGSRFYHVPITINWGWYGDFFISFNGDLIGFMVITGFLMIFVMGPYGYYLSGMVCRNLLPVVGSFCVSELRGSIFPMNNLGS